MDLRDETIRVYDRSANELAEHFRVVTKGFRGTGLRLEDIERGFELCETPNPAVVEIGCGDGRDAAGIACRTDNYVGFDVSTRMIELARQNLPEANFVVADLAEFVFPNPTHLIFAFASLVHSPFVELQPVFARSAAVMPRGGIWYVSVKEGQGSYVKSDAYGQRQFYLHRATDLVACAGPDFEQVYEGYQVIGSTTWLTLALRRV